MQSISANKVATASSVENSSLGPQNATDGNARTRWSSAFSDPQWIQIDLGKQSFINRVVLHWEEAYASKYELQLSPNLVDWFTVATVTAGNGGVDEFEGEGVFHEELPPVRYVRLNLQQRATPWGYSLWEFDVYADVGLRYGEDFLVVHKVDDPNAGVICAPTNGNPMPVAKNLSAEYAVAPLSGFKTQAVAGRLKILRAA